MPLIRGAGVSRRGDPVRDDQHGAYARIDRAAGRRTMTTKKGIQLPTKIRLMSHAEYDIVPSVFLHPIPHPVRILISNAAGASGRPFTIPTSLISTIIGITVAEFIE